MITRRAALKKAKDYATCVYYKKCAGWDIIGRCHNCLNYKKEGQDFKVLGTIKLPPNHKPGQNFSFFPGRYAILFKDLIFKNFAFIICWEDETGKIQIGDCGKLNENDLNNFKQEGKWESYN